MQTTLITEPPVEREPEAVHAVVVRTRTLDAFLDAKGGPRSSDDDALTEGVCALLGEVCAPPPRGIPWYLWPIAGAAVVGGAITTGFLVDAARDTRFCPANGCR